MGTVLHRLTELALQDEDLSFSPLLDGDGVASVDALTEQLRCTRGFSPLLDGDGVASFILTIESAVQKLFQSPSRWGRCCIRS